MVLVFWCYCGIHVRIERSVVGLTWPSRELSYNAVQFSEDTRNLLGLSYWNSPVEIVPLPPALPLSLVTAVGPVPTMMQPITPSLMLSFVTSSIIGRIIRPNEEITVSFYGKPHRFVLKNLESQRKLSSMPGPSSSL